MKKILKELSTKKWLGDKVYLLVSCSLAFGIFTTASAEESKSKVAQKSSFPALDILPKGSILQKVIFPRYDKDYNPDTLLKADKITVVDDYKINGENVHIEIYEPGGGVKMQTSMKRAVYNQKDSTLHANEFISLQGHNYLAKGTGLILHWQKKQGFLLGPASSHFTISRTQKTTSTMPIRPIKHAPISVVGAVLTLNTAPLIAEPSAKLTQQQISELDKQVKPTAPSIKNIVTATSKTIKSEDKINTQTNETMTPFLKKIGHPVTISSEKINSSTPIKAEKNLEPDAPQLLKIKCDDGIYFDSDTGVLVYLKNIRLTDSRFKLTCRNELKVFLDQKSEAKKTLKKENEKKSINNTFGELKKIIAIGNVRVISKDEKGNTFTAQAETASYDPKTEEMILRGGLPRIQYGLNQYLQSQAKGQYIRVLKNGKLITTGKWEMQIDTNQAKNK